jgi:hypothetical protein
LFTSKAFYYVTQYIKGKFDPAARGQKRDRKWTEESMPILSGIVEGKVEAARAKWKGHGRSKGKARIQWFARVLQKKADQKLLKNNNNTNKQQQQQQQPTTPIGLLQPTTPTAEVEVITIPDLQEDTSPTHPLIPHLIVPPAFPPLPPAGIHPAQEQDLAKALRRRRAAAAAEARRRATPAQATPTTPPGLLSEDVEDEESAGAALLAFIAARPHLLALMDAPPPLPPLPPFLPPPPTYILPNPFHQLMLSPPDKGKGKGKEKGSKGKEKGSKGKEKGSKGKDKGKGKGQGKGK